MDQRAAGFAFGWVRRIPLPDGSLLSRDDPPAASEVGFGKVGGHRRLRQPVGARICFSQHQGWPRRPNTCFQDVPGWSERAILGILGFLKAVSTLPETG